MRAPSIIGSIPLAIISAIVGFGTPAALAQHDPMPDAQPGGLNLGRAAHFQIWRTITLGAYEGVDAYRRALDSAGIKIGEAADEILGRPAFPNGGTKKDLELVLLTAADLGVEPESSLADVYTRAGQVGLELCPAEAALQLRLDYRNQPPGEALHIAMQPVTTYRGAPVILTLANLASTGLLLIGSDGRSGFMVPSTFRFVFALPTNGRLEAMRDPQIVSTSEVQ